VSTTTTQTAWQIVDHIIRQEIPDAVPGCERLRTIAEIDGAGKATLFTTHIAAVILGSPPRKYDAAEIITHCQRLKHLTCDVLDLISRIVFEVLCGWGDETDIDACCQRIRKTLADIKAAK
jgi:hypothetical protein